MDRQQFEQELSMLPIVQYEFFSTDELIFSPRVRYICETECPQFGKSWACPPAVGSVEDCEKRCRAHPNGLLITTMAEVADIANIELTLATRGDHEEITHMVHDLFRQQGIEPLVLSTESCAICESCAYPDGPCRCPRHMYPCVESQGILVTELAEQKGIDFQAGGNIVTWFSLFLYKD